MKLFIPASVLFYKEAKHHHENDNSKNLRLVGVAMVSLNLVCCPFKLETMLVAHEVHITIGGFCFYTTSSITEPQNA